LLGLVLLLHSRFDFDHLRGVLLSKLLLQK